MIREEEIEKILNGLLVASGSEPPPSPAPAPAPPQQLKITSPEPHSINLPIERLIKNLVCPNRDNVDIRVTLESWHNYRQDNGLRWDAVDIYVIVAVKLPSGVIHRANCLIGEFPTDELIAKLKAVTI